MTSSWLINLWQRISDGGKKDLFQRPISLTDISYTVSKLKHYGIKNKAFQWFNSYLSSRHQYVEFEGARSETLGLEMGVPQGSILGPLLFIIYVNDMHTVSNKFTFITYADDTTLTAPLVSFVSGPNYNIHSISKGINSEMKNIANWLAVNKLSINVTKTK